MKIHTMCEVTLYVNVNSHTHAHMHRAAGSNQELWLSELCLELLSNYYVYILSCYLVLLVS